MNYPVKIITDSMLVYLSENGWKRVFVRTAEGNKPCFYKDGQIISFKEALNQEIDWKKEEERLSRIWPSTSPIIEDFLPARFTEAKIRKAALLGYAYLYDVLNPHRTPKAQAWGKVTAYSIRNRKNMMRAARLLRYWASIFDAKK